eukprot:gene2095-2615_t
MLPTVINNVVEARVSLDRVQSYLLEQEHREVAALPLPGRGRGGREGVLMFRASLVHEGALEKRLDENQGGSKKVAGSAATSAVGSGNGATVLEKVKRYINDFVHRTMYSQKKAVSSEEAAGGHREDKKQVLIKHALLQSAEQTIDHLSAELARHTPTSNTHN